MGAIAETRPASLSHPAPPAVDAAALRKVYGPTVALASATFQVHAGEIHGLLGENGAGKSTLVRLLAGVEAPDGGTLEFFGQSARGGPAERRAAGLAFLHQDLGLIDEFSVADNIALASGSGLRHGLVSRTATRHAARQVLGRIGYEVDVTRPAGELTVADQTLVAVCRALADGARLIVLDEPTAYLEARQVRDLFDLLSQLRSQGVACVLITHRTEDVLRVCDRVTVLRDGRDVACRVTSELSEAELIRLITGRGSAPTAATEPGQPVPPVGSRPVRMTVDQLRAAGFGPVSFAVSESEVVGICGLADAGQFAIGDAITGVLGIAGGRIEIDGSPYAPRRPRDALRAGIGFVPADRTRDGLAGSLTAAENLLMNPRGPWWRPLKTRSEDETCRRLLGRFQVWPPAPEREVSTFSGGNQQKILLAKWLGFGCRLAVLVEPSAGVDVGAKAVIRRQIRSDCDSNGTSALVISSDFQEIADLCDRALVLRRGLIVGELTGSHLRPDLLTDLAYGGTA